MSEHVTERETEAVEECPECKARHVLTRGVLFCGCDNKVPGKEYNREYDDEEPGD